MASTVSTALIEPRHPGSRAYPGTARPSRAASGDRVQVQVADGAAGVAPELQAGLTAAELEQTRRELQASLALARPGSAVCVPIVAHLNAIDTELTWADDESSKCN